MVWLKTLQVFRVWVFASRLRECDLTFESVWQDFARITRAGTGTRKLEAVES